MKQNIINLSADSQVIGQGVICTCYLHPEDHDLCIKLPTSHQKATRRQTADGEHYRKLHKQGADFTHLADYVGPCETILGPGYLYEHVRDFDGETSHTISHYFETHPELVEELTSQLADLGRHLLANLILINDLHGDNLLWQFKSKSERKLMIVDGIGDCVMITALNIFKSVKEGKITRRWNRFIKRLCLTHPTIDFPKDELCL